MTSQASVPLPPVPRAPGTSLFPVPAELMDAFWEYDRALRSDDIDVLERLFLDHPATVRVDHTGVLQGADRIAAFRRGRSRPADRVVTAITASAIADDVVALVAHTHAADRGPGTQTQIWKRTPDGWRVAVAHVAPALAPADGATWRIQAPALVGATAAGPLDGRRVAVKDLFAVEGHRRGAGVPALLAGAEPEPEHADAVARLLAAGAHIVGIAHCDELAFGLEGDNPHYGTPRNPAAPGRIPGGSTGGPAVAVASGDADIALGTDTAGSIRVPASYLGLWGLRTTHGTVSREGLLPLAPSFDTVGWLTRDAETLSAVLDAHGIVPADRTGRATRITRGGSGGLRTLPALGSLAHPATQIAAHRLATALDAHPLSVHSDHLDAWFIAFRRLQAWQAWQVHGPWLEAHPGAVSAAVADRFAAGRVLSADDARAASELLDAARAALVDAIGDDIVLLPASAGPAPTPQAAAEARVPTLRLNALASLAGLPSLAAPLLTVDGLPVGIQLVAGPGREADLLATAGGIAAALDAGEA